MCGIEKSLDEFGVHKNGRYGRQARCRPCYRLTDAAAHRRARRVGRAGKAHNLKKYGLTLQDFDALLESQGHGCACCCTSLDGGRGTHVDHCHTSGRVRSLLCNHCNVAVGMVGESAERARDLAVYIEQYINP